MPRLRFKGKVCVENHHLAVPLHELPCYSAEHVTANHVFARGEHARRADWAELAPAMRNEVMRFDIVDEEEWQARLDGMLFRRKA